jgi:hypothetical protein
VSTAPRSAEVFRIKEKQRCKARDVRRYIAKNASRALCDGFDIWKPPGCDTKSGWLTAAAHGADSKPACDVRVGIGPTLLLAPLLFAIQLASGGGAVD